MAIDLGAQNNVWAPSGCSIITLSRREPTVGLSLHSCALLIATLLREIQSSAFEFLLLNESTKWNWVLSCKWTSCFGYLTDILFEPHPVTFPHALFPVWSVYISWSKPWGKFGWWAKLLNTCVCSCRLSRRTRANLLGKTFSSSILRQTGNMEMAPSSALLMEGQAPREKGRVGLCGFQRLEERTQREKMMRGK